MQTSSPAAPSRSATRRAWPPAPKVQSTASDPGAGSSASSSSPARTGTCARVMSSTSVTRRAEVGCPCRSAFLPPALREPPRDLARLRVELGLALGPVLAAPHLDHVEVADQRHLALE